MVKTVMETIRFLVFSNFWVSFCITGVMWSTYQLFARPIVYAELLFVFTGTLFLYSFQRLVRRSEKVSEPSDRHLWVTDRTFFLITQSVVSVIICSLCFFSFSLPTQVWLLSLAVISIFYVLPYRHAVLFGLRYVPCLKIFLISLVWTSLTLSLPLGFSLTGGEYAVWLSRFLFIVAITIPFDVRDMDNDRLQGVRTIATCLGCPGSQFLAVSLLTISGLIEIWVFQGQTHFSVGAYVLFLGLSAWILLKGNRSRDELYYSGLVEGILFLYVLANGLWPLWYRSFLGQSG
jgi:hypothetical protein